MKILVLGSRIPFPLRDGGAVASFGMLKEMANQGHDVTFFTFNTQKHFVSEDVIKSEFPFCKVVPIYLDATTHKISALWALLRGINYNLSRFNSKKGEKILIDLLEKEHFDIIHFEGIFSISFLPIVQKYSNSIRVLRQHNVEHKIWLKLAENAHNAFKKWYLKNLSNSLKTEEIKILKQFHYIVSITVADKNEFEKINPNAVCYNYPAGVVYKEKLDEYPVESKSLCHLGSMEWMPNRDAVLHFIKHIWPRVLEKYTDAKFHIAGKSLDRNDPIFRGKNIVNHGEIEDAGKFISSYKAVIVPLLSGSGLRMKTLEAMAYGRPVISTRLGATGISYTQNIDILLADSLDEWLLAIDLVFTENEDSTKLGIHGRKLVIDKYSVGILTHGLLEFYEDILNRKSV